MANKKISEFPVTTTIAGSDVFLMNHLGSTSTVAFSSLSAAISNIINTFIPTQVYDSVPIGSVHFFATSAAPTGYLECDGSVVSKTTYNDLYLSIKDTFSSPTSSNHFRLPDLRGEFIRGWDNGRGINAGRVFGSNESDAFQGHRHAVDSQANGSTPNGALVNGNGIWVAIDNANNPIRNPITDGTNGTPRTASETRPRNVALLPCIKAQKQLINLQ